MGCLFQSEIGSNFVTTDSSQFSFGKGQEWTNILQSPLHGLFVDPQNCNNHFRFHDELKECNMYSTKEHTLGRVPGVWVCMYEKID